ncbi:hypothetical protein CK203_105226 [Vitis vinifera]|uniref:Uncharacterized protein n=1 Tax=Vitis vinifera TaxID=29760 RepID=A0A438C5C6_VITVI|nr:hypothetical protein CK203_105226 [Vitis vinifera]
MRVSDGAISWDDFDGAPVASLPAQFRIQEIERYTSIGCPKIHLRLYSSVMRAHGLDEAQLIMLFPMSLSVQHIALYGIEEGIARGLWPKSPPSDSKGKKPLKRTDTKRYGYYQFSLKETSCLIPSALSPIDYYSFCIEADMRILPTRMDLHCSYHQGPGMTQIIAPLETCYTGLDRSRLGPFELTPTSQLATTHQGPSVPFILCPEDDDSMEEIYRL